MISPAASVEGFAVGSCERETIGFRIVKADASAGIRLELLISRRKSQNEVRQPDATVNPVTRAAASDDIPIGLSQREVSVGVKTVVKRV